MPVKLEVVNVVLYDLVHTSLRKVMYPVSQAAEKPDDAVVGVGHFVFVVVVNL